MIPRVLAGLVVAAAISMLARRSGSLAPSGAIAATFVGACAVAAGWAWGAVLIAYFVASSLVTRLGAERKVVSTHGMVEKGGRRDAAQVLANGGTFAALTVAMAVGGREAVLIASAALGALSASAADTWATEVGTLAVGRPRSLVTLARVQPGTSGAVSRVGLAASVGGSLFVALLGRALGLTTAWWVLVVAGTVGALADSLLGATLQERRWCATCRVGTERRIHSCGSSTTHVGGLAWLRNDAVNLAATVTGAAVAAALSTI